MLKEKEFKWRKYMANYIPITGVIQSILPSPNACCNQVITILTSTGPATLTATATTFVVNSTTLRVGMRITAFYNGDLPVPLIYPPQYQAEVITTVNARESVMLSFFNSSLTSQDQTLRLTIGRNTTIVTTNGQRFTCNIGNRMLLVYYDTTTRSIPAQTTPRKIIVFC